jgi:phosphoribosylaminoimidazole carboxylase PurE protein
MRKIQVAVLMGSDSDLPVMKETSKILDKFGINYEMHIMSAHRTPDAVKDFVLESPARGVRVFIAGAGGAAHLAGAIAAHTTLPIIGVPLDATPLDGMDALLATVQMPPGMPVATVAVGKFGAINAGLLAVQILATSDDKLAALLKEYREETKRKVGEKDDTLQRELRK